MTDGIADTSLFTAASVGRALRAAALPDRIGISTVTLAELRASLLIPDDYALQGRRLGIFLAAARMDPIPIDAEVPAAWARLRAAPHVTGRAMRVNASWIAATAIALGVPIVCMATSSTACRASP